MTHTLLNQDDEYYDIWCSIEQSLFNNNADKYDKDLDFTKSLLNVLNQFKPAHDSHQDWHLWKEATKRAHDRAITLNAPKAAKTGRKGSIEGSGTAQFVIAACLVFQPEKKEIEEQILSIYALLVLSLLQLGYNKKSENIATTIRRFTEKIVFSPSVYFQLPKLDSDLSDYCALVILSTKKILRAKKLEKTKEETSETNFLRSINELCNIILSSEISKKISPTKTRDRFNIDLDEDTTVNNGSIHSLYHYDESSEPQTEFIHEEPTLPDDKLPPTNTALATSNLSKHWLRAHYSRTPFDKNRLNPIEKDRFSRFIKDSLTSNEQLNLYTGIVLAIAYTSPFLIKNCLDFVSGKKQLPLSQSLDIRKVIITPEKSYIPPAEVKSDLLDLAEYIDLPLHPAVKKALNTIISQASGRLSIIPGPSYEEIDEFLVENFHSLKNHGQYDISQKRINLALKIEIALNGKSPITTHILTGTENEAPPVLGYYAAPSLTRILEIYKSTVHGLLTI